MIANIAGGALTWGVHFLSKSIPESEYAAFGTLLMWWRACRRCVADDFCAADGAGAGGGTRTAAVRPDPVGVAVDFHRVGGGAVIVSTASRLHLPTRSACG